MDLIPILNGVSNAVANTYAGIQERLFSGVVEPLLYQLDLTGWSEDVFDGIDWFLFGCIQICLLYTSDAADE